MGITGTEGIMRTMEIMGITPTEKTTGILIQPLIIAPTEIGAKI